MSRPLSAVAGEYAAGIRDLFRAAPVAPTDRAVGLTNPAALLQSVPVLALLSEEFNAAAATAARSRDEAVSTDAALRTLAKARADLNLAHLLLEADGAAGAPAGAVGPDRSVPAGDLFDAAAEMESPPQPWAAERGGHSVASTGDAKAELGKAVGVVQRALARHAAAAGRQAMKGVAAQGFAEVAGIAGRLGLAAADVVGLGDDVRWLARWARSFIARAYEAILSLLGEGLVQAVVGRLAEWFTSLTGDGFEKLVSDTVYGVPAAEAELRKEVAASAAPVEKLMAAKAAVDALDATFQDHTRLAGKLLAGLDSYAGYLTAVITELRLAVAVIYAAISGYVLLTGADYCDCPWLPWDRVAGVRRLVRAALT